MTLVPQTPGFPPAGEPRNAPPYPLAFRPPPGGEEPSQSFEKLLAQFLSDVSGREAGEKAAGSARDREIRGREEAAELRTAEARTRQGREADTRREVDAPPEDTREAGARSTGPGETAGSRTGEASAKAAASATEPSGDLPEGIARTPEGEAGDEREERRPALEALEAWVPGFQGPYENPAPAEHAGEETARAREGRELPLPADLAEASSPREEALSRAGVPAKSSPAAKNRAGPAAGVPERTAKAEKAGTGGDSPVPQADLPVPEQGSEVLDSPGDPGPFDGETIRTAGSEGGTEGLRYSIVVNQQNPEDALSQLSASARYPAKGMETDKPGAGGRETRGTSRRRVDLRDYRERSPREVSPGPSPASSGPSTPKLHPEVLSQDLPPAEPISRGVGEKAVPAGSGTFEETLARELHQNLNSDIVRHAQVILRDKGEGLIRLSLKPESLGNVKIRLELTENKIAGRIIVESGEALRAFEREIASLEQAFRDSGYESAELGAFLAQDGQGSGGGEERPFYSPRFAADRAASRYDETLERTDTSLSEDSEKGLLPGNRRISVNMLI